MSTMSAHQQALTDVGSDIRPPMLERASYVPWASIFRRFIDRKKETRKFIHHSIDKGPYVMKKILSTNNQNEMTQKEEDLTSDDLKRASRLVNEFDKFTAELGESLSSPEWYKYVTNVCLARDLKKDTYDRLFDHVHQYEELVNASRAKREAKTHDPLALVANTHTSSTSFRYLAVYYVTYPPSMVDFDDDYQGDEIWDYQECYKKEAGGGIRSEEESGEQRRMLGDRQ
ncbi:hypothetical protein Tco_0779318 [Tanacetum coccineum]